jgi:hypothetical protein
VARKGNSLSFTARRSAFTEVGPEEHPDAAFSRDVRPAASLNRLLKPPRRVTFLAMKLTWAIVVYLLMGLIIGWGIFMIDSKRYGREMVSYGYGRFAAEDTFGHGGSQSSCAFADLAHGLVVAWAFNGLPGERRHQHRAHELNTSEHLSRSAAA